MCNEHTNRIIKNGAGAIVLDGVFDHVMSSCLMVPHVNMIPHVNGFTIHLAIVHIYTLWQNEGHCYHNVCCRHLYVEITL